MDVLISGKTSFKVEVPYKLFQTGGPGPKPLIVYLHGFSQNISFFESLTKPFHELEAYHLYIQGPYADFSNVQKRGKWGYSWYLYNGKQGSFIKSLEYTSEFIQGVIDNIINHVDVNRVAVAGYSMGGYQAGYFALSRWKHVNDLIIIGGRIKTEGFSEKSLKKASHLNFIAVHGKKDDVVPVQKQTAEIEKLRKLGFNAHLKVTPGGHKLTKGMCEAGVAFLTEAGYSTIK